MLVFLSRGSSLSIAWSLAMLFALGAITETSLLFAQTAAVDVEAEVKPQSKKLTKEELNEYVAQLITELGHRSFAVRERSEAELSRLGIDAIDQVYEAMSHTDLEIARRSQYLVRSMEIQWADPDFSKEVRSILNRYGELTESQRNSRIEKLAKIDDLDAVAALCRISRLDTSARLSKKAALANALNYSVASTPELAEKIPNIIEAEIGASLRTGPSWLRVYRDSFSDLAAATTVWHQLIQDELKTYILRPERTNRLVIQDLIRWQADKLRSLNRKEEALAEMRNIIKISNNVSSAELTDIGNWLLDRQGYPVVEELATYHAAGEATDEEKVVTGRFSEEPSLLYILAEAKLVQKKIDEATAVAEQAFKTTPDVQESHYFIAQDLRQRGLLRWSKREFRHVFESLDIMDRLGRVARRQMAEMVHDQEDHAQAAELLDPLVTAIIEKGKMDQRQPESEEMEGIKARHQYFLGRAANKAGDIETAKTHLRKAIQFDDLESDVLIAIYKLSEDESWKKFADQKVDIATDFFKPYVERFEKQYAFFKKNRPGQDVLGSEKSGLATTLNQYAWLVGNTKGDKQHAVRASLLSLELMPGEGAYFDTLAHCYYNVGEYEKSVKAQTEAVKQMPHSGMIRQKYLFFVSEYNKAGGNMQPMELPKSPDLNFPAEDKTE